MLTYGMRLGSPVGIALAIACGTPDQAYVAPQEEPVESDSIDASLPPQVRLDPLDTVPITALRARLQESPRDTALQRALSYRLLQLKRYEESLRAFRELTRMTPDASGAWSGRAMAAYQVGLYDESVDAFERMLELDPGAFDNPFDEHIRRMWESALVRSGRRPTNF